MAIDSLDKCGVYFGTTGGRCTCRPIAETLDAHRADLPAVLSRVQTLSDQVALRRICEPAHVKDDVLLEVSVPVTRASVLDALEARYPALRGDPRPRDRAAPAVPAFFAVNEI